jgi:hypothetical protein
MNKEAILEVLESQEGLGEGDLTSTYAMSRTMPCGEGDRDSHGGEERFRIPGFTRAYCGIGALLSAAGVSDENLTIMSSDPASFWAKRNTMDKAVVVGVGPEWRLEARAADLLEATYDISERDAEDIVATNDNVYINSNKRRLKAVIEFIKQF